MESYSRVSRYVLPVALVVGLLVILTPLPAAMMDFLLAANIAAAVLILLATVFVERPLELSVFPTILLVTTLSRLVLNVATTRLILTSAHVDGLDAAGRVIQGFGQFVTGNQVVVGLIIFAIIVLIQFLVITKGATRISEVAARFALDGMHGRQLAIDADLNAGVIDQQTAQRRRAEITEQADFYGAMDGASKFLRGDAVAGLAIMAINIMAGLYIGVVQAGMGLSEAGALYTKLTIGDGLVSQLPALLISLGAGILITRGTARIDLSLEFVRQLAAKPEPLVVAAGFLFLLVFARLPALPLILIGGCCLGLALSLKRDKRQAAETVAAGLQTHPKKPPAKSTEVEDYLQVEPLSLEVGVGLIRLVDPKRGGVLLDRITGLRNYFAADLGVVLPRIRIRDNLQLGDHSYAIKLFDQVIASGECYPLRELAVSGEGVVEEVDGIATTDPSTGRAAVWIDPAISTTAAAAGYSCLPPVEVLIGHVARVVRHHADQILTREATRRLIDLQRETAPATVDELVPDVLRLADVQAVLRLLVRENVSIRNLPLILETLSDHGRSTQDPVMLAELVRERLGQEITGRYLDRDGKLNVIRPGQPLVNALVGQGGDGWREYPDFDQRLKLRFDWARQQAEQPILLTPAPLRATLRRRVADAGLEIAVLAEHEVPRTAAIRDLGEVCEAQLVD